MNPPHFHPQSLVESESVGAETRVWAFAHVMRGARIGRDCNIGDHAFIEDGAIVGDRVTIKNYVSVWEGVTIEDDVFVGPSVVLTNDLYPRSPRMPSAGPRYARKENWLESTIVEQGASIGAGAIIIAGIRLGRFCLIAAGATVTRDVEPFTLVLGSPARQVGYVCRCGQRLKQFPPMDTCQQCGTPPAFFEQHLSAETRCGSSLVQDPRCIERERSKK